MRDVICEMCGLPAEVVVSEKPLDQATSDRMRRKFLETGASEADAGKVGDPPLKLRMYVTACCRVVVNDYEEPTDEPTIN